MSTRLWQWVLAKQAQLVGMRWATALESSGVRPCNCYELFSDRTFYKFGVVKNREIWPVAS